VLAATALEPIQSIADSLCTEMSLVHFAIMRSQRPEDGSHFGVLAATALQPIQSTADSLCTESLSAFCDMRSQCMEDGSHFGALAAATLEAADKHSR